MRRTLIHLLTTAAAAAVVTVSGSAAAMAEDATLEPTPTPTATPTSGVTAPEPTNAPATDEATDDLAPTPSSAPNEAESDAATSCTAKPEADPTTGPTEGPTDEATTSAEPTDSPLKEPTAEATSADSADAEDSAIPTATASPTSTEEAAPATRESVEGTGADDSTACDTTTADKLAWAPPDLTNPTTVTVPDDGNVKLDKGKDYKLVIDGTIHGTLHIDGGDDVVLVGGEVDSGTKRAAYLQGQTGTLHIEGVKFTSTKASEGIDISEPAPTSMVQLQNIDGGGVDGSYDTHHADLVQTWSGPGQLRIDRFEGKTDYQGLFLLPTQHNKKLAKASIDLRNVVTRDVGDKSAFHAWLPKSGGGVTVKATAVVAVKPGDDLAHTVKRAPVGVKVADSARSPLVGTPGPSYTSPGYADAATSAASSPALATSEPTTTATAATGDPSSSATASEPADDPSDKPATDHTVGFSPGGPFLSQSDSGITADLAAMKRAGASEVRMDYTGDLTHFAHLVTLAKQAGLRTLALPTYGSTSGYQQRMHDLAAELIPLGVTNYELWNEPNLPTNGISSPRQYASEVLIPGYAGIKQAAKEAGAQVTVITGGLAPGSGASEPVSWVKGIYAAGGGGHFDAVGWHPYSWPDAPTAGSASWNTFLKTDEVHQVMAGHGDGDKKVWATEEGWPTTNVSEATQALMVTTAFAAWYSKPYAGPAFWYSLRDMGQGGSEGAFGLEKQDGTPKAAYAAFRAAATQD